MVASLWLKVTLAPLLSVRTSSPSVPPIFSETVADKVIVSPTPNKSPSLVAEVIVSILGAVSSANVTSAFATGLAIPVDTFPAVSDKKPIATSIASAIPSVASVPPKSSLP